LAVLILASATAMMSTHLYTPSLPHLSGYFNTTAEAVKMTMSLHVLAFGLSQLIYGPLSDRFGRRPIMLTGMAGFAIFSLCAAAAQSIGQLITARIMQGMTAGVEAVLVLAIIYDVFEEANRVKALAVWGMAIALTPAVAPIVGGSVHVFWGWRANFILIGVIGALVLFLLWKRLSESKIADRDALLLNQIMQDYRQLLTNRKFINYAIIPGAGLGMIYAFITAGPFILISRFGVATEYYGLYQAALVLNFIVGSWIAKLAAGKIDPENILRLGLLFTAAGAIALIGIVYTGIETTMSLTVVMSLVTFGMGPVFAIAPIRALDSSTSRVGAASAMVNTVQMIIGGLASTSVSVFHDGTSRPLAATVVGLLLLAAVAYGSASASSPLDHTKAKHVDNYEK